MATKVIDLSATFPEPPDPPEIPEDPTIDQIQRKFSPKVERIILVGPAGSGKTVHLMQFVRRFPDNCFSYFLTDNYWSLSQTNFLVSLCTQMNAFLGNKPFEKLIDFERLTTLFASLRQDVIDRARKKKTPCYFVVDGLEKTFQGSQGERIIDLLPFPPPARGLYFLGGIRTEFSDRLSFSYDPMEPHLFSSLDTKAYLADREVVKNQLDQISIASGGYPGYLSVMRKLIDRGVPVSKILETPSEVENLLEIQWNTSGVESDSLIRKILGIIAYSIVPLSRQTLSELLQITEDDAGTTLARTGLVRDSGPNGIRFQPDLLTKIAQVRLASHKEEAIALLTAYYEQHEELQTSNELLPLYYRERGDYDKLSNLLVPNHLVSVIQARKDLQTARRTLGDACELAASQGDFAGTLKFALGSSQLRTISDEPIGESEVQALIALKRFDRALELAYSSKLTKTRIRLLSETYSAMEQDGRIVSRKVINELEQMLTGIEQDLEPEELAHLAASVFPVSPDAATALIEKAKREEDSRSILDIAATLAAIESDEKRGNFLERIEDVKLREFTLLNAPWLGKLSAEEVIQRGSSIQGTRAREYLFREWCLQNRKNPSAYKVIEVALNSINSDPNYAISLRSLRQLSEPLRWCPQEYREDLVRRFDIPNVTGLRSPIEERVRLELNLAEAVFDISEDKGCERFKQALSSIDFHLLDADVACYCLTSVLITLGAIDRQNRFNLREKFLDDLQAECDRLLSTSADQLEISRRTLRALCSVEPKLAIRLGSRLNLFERREKAMEVIILAYLHQERVPIDVEIIKEAIDKIESKRLKDRAIRNAISEARLSDKFAVSEPLRQFIGMAFKISDPIVRCEALAELIGAFKHERDSGLRKHLYEALLESWGQIDILWMRVELAFDLVSHLFDGDKGYATDLYERAKVLRDSSSLANQSIGAMFFRTLSLAIRAVEALDLTSEDGRSTFETLSTMIEYVPSTLLRALLNAQIAIRRLRQNDKAGFDELMRDRVIPTLRNAIACETRNQVISDLGIALFEYSPAEAKSFISLLPFESATKAWVLTASRLLSNASVGDPLHEDPPTINIDSQRANKVLEAISNIEIDYDLYTAIAEFTSVIANPDNTNLSEQQKLDYLERLDILVERRLPDTRNIMHNGYVVVCKSAIEKARWRAVKRGKAILKKKHPLLIKSRDSIPNIADKAFVTLLLGEDVYGTDKELSNRLISEATELALQIPNTKDRLNRLEHIAEVCAKLRDTGKAKEAINLVVKLSADLGSMERDQILASVIQTAHEFDPELAVQLTEKIENPWKKVSANRKLKALDLAKSPQRIEEVTDPLEMEEVLSDASTEMLSALIAGRGVVHSQTVLRKWLIVIGSMHFDRGLDVARWAVESLMRHSTRSELGRAASPLLNQMLWCNNFLFELGNRIGFLSVIPPGIRQGFQGLSTKTIVFRVGEREKAIEWIRSWLQGNVREYVKIVDPYFDPKQLWILQSIPTNANVIIVCTRNSPDLRKADKHEMALEYKLAWEDRSNQAPPATVLVIHDHIKEDEYHDRFVMTTGAGFSIGTSLNGIGYREFTITLLDPEDAKHVEDMYIDPKLDISKNLAKATFIQLGEV